MAQTVNDVNMQLYQRLRRGGSEQPTLEARELTAFACKLDPQRTAEWGHIFIEDNTAAYAHILCDRCIDGEPLAYIIGEWDFCGLTFKVTSDVLIPRPETETLALMAAEEAAQRERPRVLDLCCGTGCIGIALLHRTPAARVTAIDISPAAIAVARENARRNDVLTRFQSMHANALMPPPRGLIGYDVLVSNPPYVTQAEQRDLPHSVRAFEPMLALDGGEDGLDFYRAIAAEWAGVLAPGGMAFFECGDHQGEAVAEILKSNHFLQVRVEKDLAGVPRFVCGMYAGV